MVKGQRTPVGVLNSGGGIRLLILLIVTHLIELIDFTPRKDSRLGYIKRLTGYASVDRFRGSLLTNEMSFLLNLKANY